MSIMLMHPQFDPVALQLGPIAIHWYGITYLVAFALFLLLARRRLQHAPYADWLVQDKWHVQDVEDLLTYGVMGVVLGGRLGYCLFYKLGYYAEHPIEVFYVWQGGMSFHGGMLGVIAAMALFAWQRQRPWLVVTDFIAPCVPTGLAAGRVGNFINGELWGRAADPDLSWAMVFPAVDQVARHPSQLYQFAGEGLLLAIILWIYIQKPRRLGQISGLFLLGYGIFRFLVEFAREPDAFLGLLGLGLSMGQWLSLPMIILGIYLLVRRVNS